MNRDELRSRTAITVATYALLSLAGGISLVLPDSVVAPVSSATIPEPARRKTAFPRRDTRSGAPGPEHGAADDPAPARYD